MSQPPDGLRIALCDGTFYGGDPFPAFAWMRDQAPAYFDEGAGVWGITRYADIKEISKDPDTFSNAGGIRPDSDALPMMIDFDAPEHVRRRRLVSEGFTPRRIRESEEGIRAICDAIIDRVCEQGSADFVSDIAAPLPMIVIGNMLGVAPEDRDMLLRWSDDMLKALGSPDPDAMDVAALAAAEYADLHHRRRRPPPTGQAVRRPHRHPGPRRDRGRPPRRIVPHLRVAAHPHRGRRDHPSRDQRAGCTSSCAIPISMPPWPPTAPSCPARWRRCCAGCRPSRTWPAR